MIKQIKKRKVSFIGVFNEIKVLGNSDSISEIIFFKYKLNVSDFIGLYDSMRLKRNFDGDTQFFLSEVIDNLTQFEEKRRDEYFSIYKIVLLEFINGDCFDINEFFKDKGLLQKSLDYAFILDYEFYNLFFEALEKKNNTLMKMNLVAGVEIVRKIEDGVKTEDDSVREFDIIDYYMYTKLAPSKMVLLLKKYANSPNLLFLKKFANKNDNDYPLRKNDIEQRLSDRTVYNCKFDESGKVVPGTGFEISDADKIFILEYLKQNNIPITDLTYAAGLRRFKNGVFKHKENENVKELIMK